MKKLQTSSKTVLFILFYLLHANSNAQVLDTTSMIQKAQMMTLQRFGLESKSDRLDMLEKQAVEVQKLSDFIFIKINMEHSYHLYLNGKKSTSVSYYPCQFVLAFDTNTYIYYRLNGFSIDDYQDFYSAFIRSKAYISFEWRRENMDIIGYDMFLDFNKKDTKRWKRKWAKKYRCNCEEYAIKPLSVY